MLITPSLFFQFHDATSGSQIEADMPNKSWGRKYVENSVLERMLQ